MRRLILEVICVFLVISTHSVGMHTIRIETHSFMPHLNRLVSHSDYHVTTSVERERFKKFLEINSNRREEWLRGQGCSELSSQDWEIFFDPETIYKKTDIKEELAALFPSQKWHKLNFKNLPEWICLVFYLEKIKGPYSCRFPQKKKISPIIVSVSSFLGSHRQGNSWGNYYLETELDFEELSESRGEIEFPIHLGVRPLMVDFDNDPKSINIVYPDDWTPQEARENNPLAFIGEKFEGEEFGKEKLSFVSYQRESDFFWKKVESSGERLRYPKGAHNPWYLLPNSRSKE